MRAVQAMAFLAQAKPLTICSCMAYRPERSCSPLLRASSQLCSCKAHRQWLSTSWWTAGIGLKCALIGREAGYVFLQERTIYYCIGLPTTVYIYDSGTLAGVSLNTRSYNHAVCLVLAMNCTHFWWSSCTHYSLNTCEHKEAVVCAHVCKSSEGAHWGPKRV